MKLQLVGERSVVKGGFAARSPQLGLVAHGASDTEAHEGLLELVAVWCEGLFAVGGLDKALRRANVLPLDNAPGFQIEVAYDAQEHSE